MLPRNPSALLCSLLWLSILAFPPAVRPQEVGPPSGSLVAVGGGKISPEIYERFIQLAGGQHALIVYIPSAAGLPEYGPDFAGWALSGFERQGATRTLLLHANDRQEADSDDFIRPLNEAGGVFFGGGRQWRLMDLYAGTKTEAALRRVLDRGGVIGGSSAGATILGSYLARGDTRGNQIMMGDHEDGLGYLKNVAIDQHLLRRNRHFDLLEIVEARPELLGIGLDESAAIVVSRDVFEVMDGYVAIYDAQKLGRSGRFYFLSPGDQFHLVSRVATRYSEGGNPLWLPQLEDVIHPSPSILQRYVGTYGPNDQAIEILFENGQLHLQSNRGSRRPLKAISETSFLDAASGQLLTFSERGEAVVLILGRGDDADVLERSGEES